MKSTVRIIPTLLLLIAVPIFGQDDLASLSDEFDNPSTQSNWMRIYQVEQWGADQLEEYDFSGARPGWLRMVPYSSTWYQNWRGVLAFKEVTGDFMVTTHIQPRNRAGTGAPGSQFSLAGIMIRTPRNITPQTWTPGGENYVFLSIGAAGDPGVFQFEVKTTVDSDSNLVYTDANTSEATIRSARLGNYFIMLRRAPEEDWVVHRRYYREDMPQTLQVGMTCYTDWPTGSTFDPYVHNQITITTGNPDLVADFDYYRYARVELPSSLEGVDLLDTSEVSDADLLAFLGDQTQETPTPSATPTQTPTETPTHTNTASATETQTPTSTPTFTSTETLTFTQTQTRTSTATPSPSETEMVETPTGTYSSDIDGIPGVDVRDLILFLEIWKSQKAGDA
ncbi:MAG: hypothetical protein KC978_05480 [Candidatus Omnitrophica bacterium]|nr:hypothetical protein [Candidatus Omnitrophota bacterium]